MVGCGAVWVWAEATLAATSSMSTSFFNMNPPWVDEAAQPTSLPCGEVYTDFVLRSVAREAAARSSDAEVQGQPDIVLGQRLRGRVGVDEVVQLRLLELLPDRAVLRKAMHQAGEPPRE